MLEGEQKLIFGAKRGDSLSFGALYNHYMPRIYRFLYLKTSSKQEAEDLTHEVFLSAWQNIPRYKHKGFPFSSWLYQIARNKAIDSFRTKKPAIQFDDVADENFEIKNVSDDTLDSLLDLEKIKSAMHHLGEEQHSIIIMRFVEDMSPKEIADILGKSEGSVRLMQHRAVQNLKNILKNNGSR